MSDSYSQYGQDQWVIQALGHKRGGFFLEIGAGDGLWISNTLKLEREFGWTGILVEPTRAYDRLVVNRPNSTCVNECIASGQKEVTLVEVFDKGQAGIDPAAEDNTLLSQVSDNNEAQISEWGEVRSSRVCRAYPLAEILERYGAPRSIDYFSLDVEGYEYEILRTFPFHRYEFKVLGIERPSESLRRLMTRNGYRLAAKLGEDAMYVYEPSWLIRARRGLDTRFRARRERGRWER